MVNILSMCQIFIFSFYTSTYNNIYLLHTHTSATFIQSNKRRSISIYQWYSFKEYSWTSKKVQNRIFSGICVSLAKGACQTLSAARLGSHFTTLPFARPDSGRNERRSQLSLFLFHHLHQWSTANQLTLQKWTKRKICQGLVMLKMENKLCGNI